MKKLFAILLAVAMVFTLVACGKDAETPGTNPGGNNPSSTEAAYKAAVEMYADARFHGKTSNIEEMAPSAFWRFNEEENKSPKEYMIEGIEWSITNTYETYQSILGADYTTSVSMEEKAAIAESDIALIKAALRDQKGIDETQIGDIKNVALSVSFTGTMPYSENVDITVVKIGDTWYCIDCYLSTDYCYVLFGIEQMGEAG